MTGLKFRAVIALSLTAMLGACSSNYAPLADSISVTMINTETDRYKEIEDSYAGEQTLPIRTLTTEGANAFVRGDEITGSICEIEHEFFEASVVTPMAVRIPIYGHKTREFTITCEKDGFQKTVAVIGVRNLTKEGRTNAASGAGLLGFLVAEMINAASDPEDDDYEYRTVNVSLLPEGMTTEEDSVAQNDGLEPSPDQKKDDT